MVALIYQGITNPGPDKPSNKMDLFNESMITFCTDLMILFTNFNPDLVVQFMIGWIWLGLVFFLILVNFVSIIY